MRNVTLDKRYALKIFGLTLVILWAWAYLFAMTIDMAAHHNLSSMGPGMSILQMVQSPNSLLGPPFFEALIGAYDRLLPNEHHVVGLSSWALQDLWMITLMWYIMVIAMMLPTVIPAINALNDINAAANCKKSHGAPLSGFVLGYLLAWLTLSLFASLIQWGLHQTALIDFTMKSNSKIFSAIVLILAGAYQLSSFKDSCLTKCRSPMLFFLANWTPYYKGSIWMGIRHGIVCIGCCAALMALMLIVGVMNIVGMALLAILMFAEKVVPKGRLISRSLGAGLIALGSYCLTT